MKADRELDALVAEKVMGWKYSQVSPNSERFFCRSYGLQSGWWLRPDMDTEDGWACAKCSDVPLSYSTDIGAALEALEKDDGAGWDFVLTRYAASSVPWQVEADRHVEGVVYSEAGETCALAICRVLLKTSQEVVE